MAVSINEQLKNIAENSALKQSLVPVFLCDENFNVCVKSAGAAERLKTPAVRGSILSGLEDGVAESLKSINDGAIMTTFQRTGGFIYVVIAVGNVCGHRFYAMIAEPRIIFCPVTTPWYLTDTFDAIQSSVTNLLMSPKDTHRQLSLDCTRLARLCTFMSDEDYIAHSLGLKFCRVDYMLESIVRDSQAPLALVGGAIECKLSTPMTMISYHPERELYSLITTLTVALMLVSKKNRATISCDAGDEKNTLKLSVTVKELYDSVRYISTYDELMEKAQTVKLELAAIADMAAKSDIKLDCVNSGDELTVSFCIPGKLSTRVINASPQPATVSYFSVLLSELLDIAGDSLKTK